MAGQIASIAVSEEGNRIQSLLHFIFLVNEREPAVAPVQDRQPADLLVLHRPYRPDWRVKRCVAEFDLQDLVPAESLLTFSLTQNAADFTVKHPQCTGDGVLSFDMIGVGVIARIRLHSAGTEDLSTALAAAAAAVCAGIPLAQVSETLNSLQNLRETWQPSMV